MVNRKYIPTLFSAFLFVLVVIGCTKHIDLITMVEFELTEKYDNEGYVNEPLPTNLTIVPEVELEGWNYSYSYTVDSGSGHFIDIDGNSVAAGNTMDFDPLTASLKYVGKEKGDHLIKFTANDGHGGTQEKTLRYSISDIPLIWTISPAMAEMESGDSIEITLVLSSITENAQLDYEYRVQETSGSGTVQDIETNTDVQNTFTPIALGTYLLKVTPTTIGAVSFDFDLRDGNGRELTATLQLEVEEIAYVLIPDANFERFLIAQGYDTDGEVNGRILGSDAEQVTKLIMNGRDITDLTGIEGFTALTDLEVYSGLLNTVDLSKNINLEVMNLGQNNLQEIDLSNNLKMKRLYIGDNPLKQFDPSILPDLEVLWLNESQLTEIDVSQNPLLRELHLNENELSRLDITNNPMMEELVISDNRLSELDLSQNDLIAAISAFRNQFTELDVRNLSRLQELNIISNQLSTLDVTQNTELTLLNLNSNNLQELDLSANTELSILNASAMQLTAIDLRNNSALMECSLSDNALTEIDFANNPRLASIRLQGNDLNALDVSGINDLQTLYVRRNPGLSCIQVSNVTAANANPEWQKDDTVEYRIDCN